MTSLRFNPSLADAGDADKCPDDPRRDTTSKQLSAVRDGAGLWFKQPLSPVFDALGPVNQSGLTEDIFPLRFSHSYGFGSSHNDTDETEMMSTHETIVIMEEDPAVTESATYLYERHPKVSTLLKYQKGALHLLRGGGVFSARSHDVLLVGHGRTGTNGKVQLGGHGPEELVKLVLSLKAEHISGPLGTISLIGCSLGNDPDFMQRLLRGLRSVGVETKLLLYSSFLSVSSDGQIVTRTDGVWTSHDHSRRVTAELDQSGGLLTEAELGCAGQEVPGYRGHVLYLQTLEWPSHPQMFVPMLLRKKYPSIDCLEGLTWSLFFEENERRRAPDYIPFHNQQELNPVWLTEPGPSGDNIFFKHIVNIQDLLVEIRYNAREEVSSDLYYVLNDCIYKVHKTNLSVSLAGKFMATVNQVEVEQFRHSFIQHQGEASMQELSEGLKASKFIDFCRQTFQYQECNYNCERWGRYFMSAVFSASVRNFRIFSLFLMSTIGCEVGRSRGSDSPLCTAFVDDHPMASEEPWPDHLRRGFYGCTVTNFEMATQDRQIWLDQVVRKENALYVKSKQIMNAVDHDEQTELDIFGKVKVMNKYVFSSYLEYFRGTPEGKKLKRGCTPSLQEDP